MRTKMLFALLAFTATSFANGIDTSFGVNGRVLLESLGDANVNRAILQADGKIVLVGSTPAAGDTSFLNAARDMLVVRCTADGALDNSFGQGGVVRIDFTGTDDRGHSVVQQADGKLVIAGYTSADGSSNFDFAVARLNANGSLDATFDGDGRQAIDAPYRYETSNSIPGLMSFIITADHGDNRANDVLALPDGNLLVVGTSNAPANTTYTPVLTVVRLLADGSIDTSFGSDGTGLFRGSEAHAPTAFLREDGSIDIAGDPQLVRINAAGSAVQFRGINYFRSNGSYHLSFHGLSQPGGNLLLAGFYLSYSPSMLVAAVGRLDSSLMEDTAFGNAGAVTGVFGSNVSVATLLAQEPEGKILVGGSATRAGGAQQDAVIARITSDGAPDENFGSDGVITVSFDGSTARSFSPVALLRSSDGKLFVVGNQFEPNGVPPVIFSTPTPGSERIGIIRVTSTPQFQWSQPAASISENQGLVSVEVRRVGMTMNPVTVSYSTASETATDGTDFTTTAGTLTWLPGDPDTKTIVVPLRNDSLSEPSKQFAVRLSNPSEGSIDTESMAVTIVDDDASAGGRSGGGGALDVWSLLAAALASLVRRRLKMS